MSDNTPVIEGPIAGTAVPETISVPADSDTTAPQRADDSRRQYPNYGHYVVLPRPYVWEPVVPFPQISHLSRNKQKQWRKEAKAILKKDRRSRK